MLEKMLESIENFSANWIAQVEGVFEAGKKLRRFFSKPVLRTDFSEEMKGVVSGFDDKYHLTNFF